MDENQELFTDDELDSVEDSSKQVERVYGWFEEAKKYRRIREQQWRINEKLLKNDIDMSGAVTQTNMKFNIPLAIVEGIKPTINDFLPTFDVMPEGANDVHFADLVQKRKKQIEDIGNFRTIQMDAIAGSLEYSDGMLQLKPVLEEEKDEKGEVVNQILKGIDLIAKDIFTWYPAPHSTGMILGDQCRFQIFATPMHRDEIKREFGISIKGEGKLDDQRGWIDTNDTDENGDYGLVIECYSADVDAETYPNGRVTLTVEHKLISDEPLEMYRIPYFQFSNYKSAHDTFGYGEPELVATQTKAINEGMSSMFDSLREFGNPKRKIVKSLYNKLTQNFKYIKNIQVNKPDDVSYLQATAPSQSMFSAIELTLRLIDVVTGQNDVSAGRNQTSNVTSGKAIMALQEASQARVRYKISKEVSPTIEDLGEMVVWFIQNFDQEIISIREESANGEQSFTQFDPQQTLEGRTAESQDAGEDFDPRTFRTLQDTKLNIRVTAGFTQPSGRLSRKEEADINFDSGRYGIERWANASDEPDKQELINEFYERQGDAQRKELQAQFAEELPKIIEEAKAKPEEFEGSQAEDQLLEMITQLPELMLSQDFQSLPNETKLRLAQAMALGGQQQEQEQMPNIRFCHLCDSPTMNPDGICDNCKKELVVHINAPAINLSGYIARGLQQE